MSPGRLLLFLQSSTHSKDGLSAGIAVDSVLHRFCFVDVLIVFSSSKEALTTPFRRSASLRANSLLKYPAIWQLKVIPSQQRLPCCQFLLLVRIHISCKNDCTCWENLVDFFSFFKAQPPQKMDSYLVQQSILLLEEIINLLTEHH